MSDEAPPKYQVIQPGLPDCEPVPLSGWATEPQTDDLITRLKRAVAFDERLFYDLMQSYRHAPIANQVVVAERYDAVRDRFARLQPIILAMIEYTASVECAMTEYIDSIGCFVNQNYPSQQLINASIKLQKAIGEDL